MHAHMYVHMPPSLPLSLSLTITSLGRKSSDTTGYDEYVEGVEPEETASLETHIGEVGKTITEPQHVQCVCTVLLGWTNVCLCVCSGQAYSFPPSSYPHPLE